MLLAAGVWVARNHRRALIGAGLGLAASMLILGAGLLVFRGIYLNGVPASLLPSGQEPDQRGEYRAVGPVQPGPRSGAAQHGDLVPQHQQFRVFRRR